MHPSFWTQVNHHTGIFLRRWGNSWSTQRKDKTWRSYPGPEGWLPEHTLCLRASSSFRNKGGSFHTPLRDSDTSVLDLVRVGYEVFIQLGIYIYIYFSLCFSRKGIFHLIIKGTTTHLRLQKKLDVFHLAKASFYDLMVHSLKLKKKKKKISIHPLNSSIQKHFWRREWQPTPVFLTGESHG